MHFPTLKYPRLCRLLPYVVVLGCAIVPIVVVCCLHINEYIKIAVVFGVLIALLAYLSRYFMVLMSMDAMLATLSCYRTARKQYTLSATRSEEAIRRSILGFGRKCDPSPLQPQPFALRYRFSQPMTIYSKGIERILAAYDVDLLDKHTYKRILSSGKTNSIALEGRQKAHFLDKDQKRSPLHRVTVVLILARHIDPFLLASLYDLACKEDGDEWENCTIPCIVDLENNTCVFNSIRLPYCGYSYPVKNRGIRMIKKYVFGGNLNLRDNHSFLLPVKDVDPESSLWAFWKNLNNELVDGERQMNRRFNSLGEREICVTEDSLYLMWDHRGICQTIKLDAAKKQVLVEKVDVWVYPNARPISKKILRQIEDRITDYYARQGYQVSFVDLEDILE